MSLKVSVVIPAYNEAAYIKKCLDALMAQEEPADEIIVVDNNSTDDTVAIAQQYPVRILHEQTQGIIPTRNTGFDAARYPIIARTDADTEVAPDWVKEMKHIFEDNPKCQAVTGAANYDGLPESISYLLVSRFLIVCTSSLGHYPLIGPNFALRNTMWQKISREVCTSDREVHEDIDLSIHIHQFGGEIVFHPHMRTYSSLRRIMNKPQSFFVEYPQRLVKMFRNHGIPIAPSHFFPAPRFPLPKDIFPSKKSAD